MRPDEMNDMFWLLVWIMCLVFAVTQMLASLAKYMIDRENAKKRRK